jgi:hypothetical protein
VPQEIKPIPVKNQYLMETRKQKKSPNTKNISGLVSKYNPIPKNEKHPFNLYNLKLNPLKNL